MATACRRINAKKALTELRASGRVNARSAAGKPFQIRKNGPVPAYAVFVGGRRKTPYRTMDASALMSWLNQLCQPRRFR